MLAVVILILQITKTDFVIMVHGKLQLIALPKIPANVLIDTSRLTEVIISNELHIEALSLAQVHPALYADPK